MSKYAIVNPAKMPYDIQIIFCTLEEVLERAANDRFVPEVVEEPKEYISTSNVPTLSYTETREDVEDALYFAKSSTCPGKELIQVAGMDETEYQ